MKTVDSAFLSRVDTAMLISNPNPVAAFEILRSCLNDLVRNGKITVPERKRLRVDENATDTTLQAGHYRLEREDTIAKVNNYFPQHCHAAVQGALQMDSPISTLLTIANHCVGFSGRLLRRLPLLSLATHTFYEPVSLDDALGALALSVEDETRTNLDRYIEHETSSTKL
jgi:hypothetical protein